MAGILLTRYAPVWVGGDYRLYMDAAREWLQSGTFYRAYQLTAPYDVHAREVLYPPVGLWLFVPFAFLPAVLWWAIPVGVTLAMIAWHRPGPWRIVGMLALLALPVQWGTSYSLSSIVNGNPVIWVAMFVALATRWPAFAPFAFVKFTLAPFALVGIGHRGWVVGAAALVALSLPFGSMWLDYGVALVNAKTAGPSILYSVGQFPLVLIPLIASWPGRRQLWVTPPGGVRVRRAAEVV